jgi:serine/threonine protein kinase
LEESNGISPPIEETEMKTMNWIPYEISIPPGHPRAGEKVLEFRRDDGQRVRTPALIAKRYQVEDILTAGGQGAILKARDRVLRNRLVLVKMTLLDLDDIFPDVGMVRPNVSILIEDRRNHLADERSMLLQLNQRLDDRIPVVCHYLYDYSAQLHGPHGDEGWYWDADEDDRTQALLEREPYLVLRYIDGTSLIDRLRPSLATDRRTEQAHAKFSIRIGLHLASIFAQLHSRRSHRPDVGDDEDDAQARQGKIRYYYVYQDLKPENLIVTHGDDLFLIDFGGVEIVEVDDDGEHFYGRKTQTPGYSAPEVLEDPPRIGELSDIYSLGATLYHVLSGERPPQSGLAEAVEKLRTSLRDLYYHELLDVVAACVVTDPDARRDAVSQLPLSPVRVDTSLTYTLRRNLYKLSKEV